MIKIEKEAKAMHAYNFNRFYTKSARAALLHILQSKAQENPELGILLPAYIGLSLEEGSGVFDPVIESSIPYAFYNLSVHLEFDLDEIEKFLEGGKFQLFLLVHYFGIPQCDIDKIKRLCHSYNVKIIEDCAHVPFLCEENPMNLGFSGDYSIHSIHKNIATSDGGFYVDNFGDLPQIKDRQKLISPKTLTIFSNTMINDAANARLYNYNQVTRALKQFKKIKLFFNDLPDGCIPLNCPIIIEKEKRHFFYTRLMENNIYPTALYHRLIPEIQIDIFPDSHFLSNSILNLPTHPDINLNFLNEYIDIIISICSELSFK